jgi:hypothetical protein
MKTSAKLCLVAVCGLGVAVVIGISMSRPPQTGGNVNSSASMAPVETLHVEQRQGRSSMRLPSQAASIPPTPVVADADSSSPDALEDPDEIRAWARSHPQHAREWLANASEGVKRDTVAEIVCLQIAETNPAAAVALADGYGAGCTNVLENLAMQWAGQDIQAASNWAATKPAGAQRDNLLSRIAFVESKTYPENAATLVAELIPAGQIQDEAAISVLYQWAQKDPRAAMKWAQTFSAGALHDRAVSEVQNIIASNSQRTSLMTP